MRRATVLTLPLCVWSKAIAVIIGLALRRFDFSIGWQKPDCQGGQKLFRRCRSDETKSFLFERRLYLLDMLPAGRFYHKSNLGFAERDVRESAAVFRAQHVRALRCDACREARERSGPVGQYDRNFRQTAVLDQALLDDAGNQVHVDVAA